MSKEETKRGPGRPKTSNPATRRLDMRITDEQHERWSNAAVRDGYVRAGDANISGWLKDLADKSAK
ncbi:hypothetical protein PU634_05060 [Oceanimonas pelagia]|uniref:Uncharacterized protein n=1 Tax=Oceanimonas pelagia TaxID=3028314 RepID=A0AA50QCY2_9GAMM|nr:hypothetical protein [Oceanimonas pelagia]WMC11737.1 hypothetical protein PU634_05060 [Oceanimonas pelagia]